MKEKTCEEKIDDMLKMRIKDFQEAIEKYENSGGEGFVIDGNKYEDFIDWINEYCLAYGEDGHYRGKRLELSWGGPADGFIFCEDGTIIYYYQDWFDGAERILFGKDYDIMEKVKNYLEV
ncbi:MAG: hypothetical protein QXN68_00805 [Thermoplasmata archaeon]